MEWYENRILSAQNGANPMLMKELKGGYVVFGDVQFLPGYCVLLSRGCGRSAKLQAISWNSRKLFYKFLLNFSLLLKKLLLSHRLFGLSIGVVL